MQVALSFVQRPEDMAELKGLVRGRCAVMAKLEKPSAVGPELDPILRLSDACMVVSAPF